MTTLPVNVFREELLSMLDEVFEQVHGYILDHGTSIFETLASVTAEEASQSISKHCAPISAQVNHLRFYLDTLNEAARTGEITRVDWASSWQVGQVTNEEWKALVTGLRTSYDATRAFATTHEGWTEDTIGGAFAIVAHSAYHLGEIRQALGVIRG